MFAIARQPRLRTAGTGSRAVALSLSVLFVAGCGDSASDTGTPATDAEVRSAVDAGDRAPTSAPSDPCAQAGYYFDGSSDCDEVRCPTLRCECPVESAVDAPPTTTSVELTACTPQRGCLSRADCARVCSPTLALAREACEQRIEAAGAFECSGDAECRGGECRRESVGSLCIETLGCGEDGHCPKGSRCLFQPSSLDEATGAPTAPGDCSDGAGGSHCYADSDCDYGHCNSQVCSGGLVGDSCSFDSHCASGFCRTVESSVTSGSCVSGEAAGACVDASDCREGLHCTGGRCFTGAAGQPCEDDAQCDSRVCMAGACQSRQSGAYCETDGDCDDGFCVSSVCASGSKWAPCSDGGDCDSGLMCTRNVCSDGALGMPCIEDAECSVLACVNGRCSDGSDGSPCDAPDECTSGRCADPAGAGRGECTSGAAGAFCHWNDNCLSNSCGAGNRCD